MRVWATDQKLWGARGCDIEVRRMCLQLGKVPKWFCYLPLPPLTATPHLKVTVLKIKQMHTHINQFKTIILSAFPNKELLYLGAYILHAIYSYCIAYYLNSEDNLYVVRTVHHSEHHEERITDTLHWTVHANYSSTKR